MPAVFSAMVGSGFDGSLCAGPCADKSEANVSIATRAARTGFILKDPPRFGNQTTSKCGIGEKNFIWTGRFLAEKEFQIAAGSLIPQTARYQNKKSAESTFPAPRALAAPYLALTVSRT